MYAPLQKTWCQVVLLSHDKERHLKALLLFLAVFGLLGWTYAGMAVGLFYACSPLHYSQLDIGTSQLRWYYQGNVYEGIPARFERGVCWVSFQLSGRNMTIWRWQLSSSAWRKLCALSLIWYR